MKPENAIEVKDVYKKYRIYKDRSNTIKELILFKNRRNYETREVLKGISFEVRKGEVVGFIGHNGCGKSTTLKLLTKIMYPDSGKIEMAGRVVSLIELGAGFHPDMSGRENIFINASIFGLTRKEIQDRLDEIISFSELEDFIDNPVRTYSSGMYARLAFSVAINVNADILLIDEILAVGDIGFQTKCFNRLRELKQKGVTIVIVSHSLSQIEAMCDYSIWLHEGNIKMKDKSKLVHKHYVEFMKKSTRPVANGQRESSVINEKRIFELYPISGFHREEYNGKNFMCWMKEKRAVFGIRNSEGKFQSHIKLKYINGIPLEHYGEVMELKVFIQDTILINTKVDYTGYTEFEIPQEFRRENIEIILQVSYLWKPDKYLSNGDKRMLGISLVLTDNEDNL